MFTASRKYTDKDRARIATEVIDVMVTGKSCNQACKMAGVPLTTFLMWVNHDDDLAVAYAYAREIMIETIADETMSIADEIPDRTRDGRVDHGYVSDKRLRVDTRKWLLSKVAHNKYGDRINVTSNNEDPFAALSKALNDYVKKKGVGPEEDD